MSERRVVVTGIGVVAPTGIGKEAFWEGIKNGKNCVDRISSFDPSSLPSQIAAEAKEFDPLDYYESEKEVKRADRSAHLAFAAAFEAIKDSEIKINDGNRKKIGVLIGTGIGGLGYAEKEHPLFLSGGANKISPYLAITPFCGALSSEISIKLGIKGFSLTVSTGCTGSNDALSMAFNLIRFGESDVILSGGADSCITPLTVAAFSRIGALSTKRNHEPHKACRPFDKERDGFVIGEGAWVLVLEELEHAIKRNAPIYAEIYGYGITCDAYHMTAPLPDSEETARAMELAIENAGIHPEQIDYICAHGTSTPLNDKQETLAIKKVFKEHARKIPISSIKAMIGHAIGAAGAANVTATILAMVEKFIPPTINYEHPDPECDLDYVPNIGRKATINFAMCNSIGFGGKNSILVLKKFK